ncbi:MAG: CPBP family intramembrane metalloprotease [Nitrososphaerota archaeon]|nr:CPBP family intramembrane metalloprotease [Nitrososphaerota archaeon]MDG6939725.1 CPBP family intramembrane metalloprotease [Nitrososphaerota archaeon]
MKAQRGLRDLLLYAVVGSALAMLALMFLSFPLGAYAFNDPGLGGISLGQQVQALPVFLLGVALLVQLPAPLTLGEVFVLVWSLYLTFFVLLLMGPWSGVLSALRRLPSDKSLSIYSSGALTLAVVFPATLVLAALMEAALSYAGVPVGGLTQSDPRSFFYDLTLAPLIEEVGFRVSFVGLASLAIAWGATRKAGSLRALWHPSRALSEAGVQPWRSGLLYASVAVSALAFGGAHVLYGGGWEAGKVISATVVGAILAVVYYTHGLPAAVMLHWSFDYFQAAYQYFDQVRGLPGISTVTAVGPLASYTQTYVIYAVIFSAVMSYLYAALVIIRPAAARRSAFKGGEAEPAPVHAVGGNGQVGIPEAPGQIQRGRPVRVLPDGRRRLRPHRQGRNHDQLP